MFIRENSIKKVQEFVKACQKIPVPITKAILFGSVAKETATQYSDIDVALFSEQFSDNILDNLQLIGTVNILFPEIEVHAFPKEQFFKDGILMDEIRKTGIEILL